jgi:uncharacterized protein with von Willebrand factor type A (vWA) domain
MRARRGPWADLRRTLRESVRNDGEVLRLGRLKRRTRPRKILLLIDVSGSMKGRTDDNMKLAHTLAHAIPHVETFTFGTRLTRVTRALRLKRREQALSAAAHLVSDWEEAPASATHFRLFWRCQDSAATPAAPRSSSSPTALSAAIRLPCATPSPNCRGAPGA